MKKLTVCALCFIEMHCHTDQVQHIAIRALYVAENEKCSHCRREAIFEILKEQK